MPRKSTSADVPPDWMPANKPKRRYTGPAKGSDEAKERMARVRAAQWAKNGLVYNPGQSAEQAPEAAPSSNTSFNTYGHAAAPVSAQGNPRGAYPAYNAYGRP